MTAILFFLGYLALPAVVGFTYWRANRKREALLWSGAVLLAPIAGFLLAMALMAPLITGEGLGHAVVAGFIGIFAWLGVGVAGLILTARTPRAKP